MIHVNVSGCIEEERTLQIFVENTKGNEAQ